MAENYYYSSLSGQEIEDALLGAVRSDVDQSLTTSEKARARANIGAGESDSTFKILGYFDTYEDMIESLQLLPQPGDAYGIGTASPYDVYVYDGVHDTWVNNGPIVLSDAVIDDEDIATDTTWSSSKINTEIGALNTSKQAKITASGILKGDGSGGVSAAAKGTDYGGLTRVLTLQAANWSNNTQTLTSSTFLSSGYVYIVSPASGSFVSYCKAQIYADNVTTDGSMVFHCGTVPSVDLVVNIVRVVSA